MREAFPALQSLLLLDWTEIAAPLNTRSCPDSRADGALVSVILLPDPHVFNLTRHTRHSTWTCHSRCGGNDSDCLADLQHCACCTIAPSGNAGNCTIAQLAPSRPCCLQSPAPAGCASGCLVVRLQVSAALRRHTQLTLLNLGLAVESRVSGAWLAGLARCERLRFAPAPELLEVSQLSADIDKVVSIEATAFPACQQVTPSALKRVHSSRDFLVSCPQLPGRAPRLFTSLRLKAPPAAAALVLHFRLCFAATAGLRQCQSEWEKAMHPCCTDCEAVKLWPDLLLSTRRCGASQDSCGCVVWSCEEPAPATGGQEPRRSSGRCRR